MSVLRKRRSSARKLASVANAALPSAASTSPSRQAMRDSSQPCPARCMPSSDSVTGVAGSAR